jgi:hypothetical protein
MFIVQFHRLARLAAQAGMAATLELNSSTVKTLPVDAHRQGQREMEQQEGC